jgi:peptidoglycan hydrolase-like protein with peptidoglycan-binding domain
MRTLKLQTPHMRGSDVADWQRFLIAEELLAPDTADGDFGKDTAAATRGYQTSAGLGADGVVGPLTYHSAVRDGLTSSTRPLSLGMDASSNCTTRTACILGEKITFVMRYYSRSAAKRLTLAEARALAGAGLSIGVVYQDRQDRLEDFTAVKGRNAATEALAQATALGQPGGSAIYFAADFNPSSEEAQGPVAEYFQAVNDVFTTAGAGASSYRVGVYGSGLTCRIMRDSSLAGLAWLSQSTGFREHALFRPRAHVLQIAPSRKICSGKLAIDDNVGQTADLGTFRLL